MDTKMVAPSGEREYRRSHPWITFTFQLQDAPVWLLLGEARSKIEHIKGVPLQPKTAQDLHKLFLAKGALATTAIEGNTLSEAEALQAIEGQLRLPASRDYQRQELMNIVEACNQILNEVLVDPSSGAISVERIEQFNRMVLKDLPPEGDEVAGEIRTHSVTVGGVYRGAPPEDCRFLLESLSAWLNGPQFQPPSPDQSLTFALLKAVLAHLYIAWIHPFGNGNGRTARLVEFQILIAAGVPSPAVHLFSNHYNETRPVYYRELMQASRSGGDVMPFLIYALRGFVDGLRSQIDTIRVQQWTVSWEHFVHSSFVDQRGPTVARRRRLVLELTNAGQPVAKSHIAMLSPELALAYSTKGEKTLTRDLNGLADMGLVKREPGGKYRALSEVILAFLPPAADPR